MKIILVLLGMLGVCWLSGAAIAFALRANENLKKLSFHIGYAYILVAFHFFYLLVNSAFTAAVFTVSFPLLWAATTRITRALKRGNEACAPAKPASWMPAGYKNEFIYPVVASLAVALLAAWPYLLSGWGAYWLSGSEDIEDDLNGRDAYVYKLILDTPPITIGEILGIQSWRDSELISSPLAKREYAIENYKQWYTEGQHRFHYGNLAFWSALFNEYRGIDILLVQSILKLILMTIGLFYLARHAFSMTPMVSAVAAGISAGSAFYMTSFFAGHTGSLLYGALIPGLLHCALVKDDDRRAVILKWIFGGLIAVSIAYSYPHPLAIIALPLSLYWLSTLEFVRSRVMAFEPVIRRNPVIIYIGFILLTAAIIGVLTELWHLTEWVRLRQDGQYRSWGYTHDWVIVPLFLGLIPAPGQGMLFIGSIIGKSAYSVFILLSCLFAAILAILYFLARPVKNHDFFLIFGLFWIVEYFIFRYFVIDSYYIYKFLYIHQFILVIGLVAYVSASRSRLIKLFCAFIVLANLASNLVWGHSMRRRPHNQNTKRVASLPKLDHAMLEKSYIDLTGGDVISVRQTLKANGIKTVNRPQQANYFIVKSGVDPDVTGSQLTETVGEIAGFAIKRAPSENYLMVNTYNEPERFPGDPVLKDAVFRWVGHRKHNNLDIHVVRPGSPEKMAGRYLRACFHKGPSAENGITITIFTSNNEVLGKFTLDDQVHCEWLPAERVLKASQPLRVRSWALGESLIPYDDRILMYRVFAVGWTDRLYDDKVMSFFNTEPDIVKKTTKKPEAEVTPDVTLHLGQGWGAYEKFGDVNFRWVGRSAELVLTGGDKDGVANVVVELEPGPSHGKKVLELEVWDRTGNLLFTGAPITGRNSVVLPLSYRKQQTSVYALKAKSLNLPLYGDSRILNYRVFNIALQ